MKEAKVVGYLLLLGLSFFAIFQGIYLSAVSILGGALALAPFIEKKQKWTEMSYGQKSILFFHFSFIGLAIVLAIKSSQLFF